MPVKIKYQDITLFMLIIISSAMTLHYGMRQFGGYDLSHLIDLQSRLFHKEAPGIDFINTLPFSYIFIVKLFGIFVKPSWASLIWMNLILAAVCALTIVTFWPQKFEDYKKYSAIFLIYMPVIGVSHIWHSAMSQIIGITYIVLSLKFIDQNHKKIITLPNIFLTCFSGFFFFSKQNIGLPVISMSCGSLIIFSFYIPRLFHNAKLFLLINFLGILTFSITLLLFLKVSPNVLIDSFTDVTDRAAMSQAQYDDLIACLMEPTSIGIIGFSILTLFTFKSKIENYPFYPLLFSALLGGFIPIITDWDLKLCSLSFFIFILVLLGSYKTRIEKLVAILLYVSLLFSALEVGIFRQHMRGSGDFFGDPLSLIRIDDGYFKGLYTGTRFHGVRYETHKILQQMGVGQAVFFGPRIEFSYMDNELNSPNLLPLWWHPGSSYPLKKDKNILKSFEDNNFSLLVFLAQDKTRMPGDIIRYVDKYFEKIDGYTMIDVYRRR